MTARVVIASTPNKLAIAKNCATQFQLPLLDSSAPNPHADFILFFADHRVELQHPQQKKAAFYLDFASATMRYRLQTASLRKEALARAMGAKPSDQPTIIDATAGFGRDSFILASLGFRVRMLEQSAVVYLLLQDALARAKNDARLADIVDRLELIHADAMRFLPTLSVKPDVIYLDPMFPPRQKSAAVKKELVLLQQLIPNKQPVEAFIRLALACARRRVVVKRPRLAEGIEQLDPHFSLSGKSTRFDIYLTQT